MGFLDDMIKAAEEQGLKIPEVVPDDPDKHSWSRYYEKQYGDETSIKFYCKNCNTIIDVPKDGNLEDHEPEISCPDAALEMIMNT